MWYALIDVKNDDNTIVATSHDVDMNSDNNDILGRSNVNTKLSTVYDGNDLIATLTDENGNPVSGAKIGFANNGVTYIRTDKNGKAIYSTKGLKSGIYTIKIKYYGDDTYSESNQVVTTITVNSDIVKSATTLTTDYADGVLVATLKDANGKAVSGAKVGFANNGVKYIVTDANGQAKYSTDVY